MKKLGAFVVYTLSLNLADLNWAKEQSTSIRYLWLSNVRYVYYSTQHSSYFTQKGVFKDILNF